LKVDFPPGPVTVCLSVRPAPVSGTRHDVHLSQVGWSRVLGWHVTWALVASGKPCS
jgi:hypothetical protein